MADLQADWLHFAGRQQPINAVATTCLVRHWTVGGFSLQSRRAV